MEFLDTYSVSVTGTGTLSQTYLHTNAIHENAVGN